MESHEMLAVSLPVADWVLIDGTLDDLAPVSGFGNPSLPERVLSIRQILWEQVPGWPEDTDAGRGWPPQADCKVRLERTQWEFVLDALEAAAPTERLLAGDQWLPQRQRTLHEEAATRSLQIAADLRAALR
jgi:hypothetical protein